MRTLSIIFQWNWESGEVSVGWKLATVPVSKKGKKKDPFNYRPVGLTSVPSKIMENIFLGIVEKHLKYNSVIGHDKNGFKRKKCSLMNLISLHNKVKHLIHHGKPVDVKISDYSKAFNTEFQSILLDK